MRRATLARAGRALLGGALIMTSMTSMTSSLGCHPAAAAACSTCGQYEAEVAAWRAERIAALRAEQGWLALAGLFWLAEGEQSLGAVPGVDIEFPAGAPAAIGSVRRTGAVVSLRVAPGVDARLDGAPITEVVLRSDADPQRPPDRVHIGERFTFLIVARGDRLGLRLYDSEAPGRRMFAGIPAFPVAPEWRIQARFEAYAQPRTIEHPTVLGTVQPAEVPGVAVFSIAGQEHRLTPIRESGPDGESLLFVFRDLTSGSGTYAGGRFLLAAPAKDGYVELDFNRAHNPPCAFTPYATCPVPLPENRLPVRVTAGEQLPADHS